jgi:hypothetical protein
MEKNMYACSLSMCREIGMHEKSLHAVCGAGQHGGPYFCMNLKIYDQGFMIIAGRTKRSESVTVHPAWLLVLP